MKRVWQINLQTGFGGGEIYTVFLTHALEACGITSEVVISRQAEHWQQMLPVTARIHKVDASDQVSSLLPQNKSWVLSHGGLGENLARSLADRHCLTGIAHMPLYGRRADGFAHHHRVYGVSTYVRDSLLAFLRPDQVYPNPLYGIARGDIRRDGQSILRQQSRYDWDRRKGRDRLLGCLEPLLEPLRSRPVWQAREGISLGIVSRLTPIKQFPLLFSYLVPQLLARPVFNLEVFGAGGYASVRDLSQVLRPLGSRVRYWGHQADVGTAYGCLDYLLTGLPEKEALGLNVIEAQSCHLPVLAISAPPFTETVLAGQTGYFYRDPREDQGADFLRLLDDLSTGPALFNDPSTVECHLKQFTADALKDRIVRLLRDPLLSFLATQS
ncbi:MAG TPA: glycosyltransferase [Rhodocyclaceae bacterium]|jgi:glycosyltransferase involved in cell wall biosynthesis